jgi:hypothetical protein
MPLSISGIIPVNLSDLHDVSIAAPQTGQYLRYNAGMWQNSPISTDVYSYLDTNLLSTDGITLLKLNSTSPITIGLEAVNLTPGTFGSASSIPVFTVDSQGRITSIASAASAGAASADSLTTARNISTYGDADWTVLFDGSMDVSAALTLSTVNVAPPFDAFCKITVNGKGLVTNTSAVTASDIESSLNFTPLNVAGDTMTGALILNADPVLPLGAVTKQYADSIASGVNIHASCETSTTAALAACTYNNGTAGVGATLTANANGVLGTIGGYATLIAGSRLLVKNQVAQLQNGIYIVTDLGSVSTPWILTRATDFDGSPTAEIQAGDLTYVSEGTLNGTQWVQTAIGTGAPGDYIIIGTNAISFTQFSGAGSYVAGTGINISATTISNTGVTSLIAGANVAISASTGAVTISTTGTVPSSTTASNVAGGAAGSIPYQTAASTTAMLASGTGVLVGGATPSYTTTPTLTGTNFSGTAAALNIGGNAGTVTNGLYTTGVGTITNTMLAGSIDNSKLLNSTLTVGTTSISLGSSSTTLGGLTSVTSTTFNGAIVGSGAGLTSIPNSALVGSGSFALGSTSIALGSTILNVAGLTSVTSTSFVGALTGNASTATTAGTVTTGAQPNITSVGTLTSLTVTGAVNAGSLNATSTIRVKKAVKNLSKKYLSKFNDLRPREYDRKDYVAHEFGFIAEEMADVYPEVVGRDAAGVPSGIDYGKLSTILTAKIQEQQATIDKLQSQMSMVLALLKGKK